MDANRARNHRDWKSFINDLCEGIPDTRPFFEVKKTHLRIAIFQCICFHAYFFLLPLAWPVLYVQFWEARISITAYKSSW